jgi:hypothetical protein
MKYSNSLLKVNFFFFFTLFSPLVSFTQVHITSDYKFETGIADSLDSMAGATLVFDNKTQFKYPNLHWDLPFKFEFARRRFDRIWIYNGGIASFNEEDYDKDVDYPHILSNSAPCIYLFANTGKWAIVRTVTRGVSPNRIVIFDWRYRTINEGAIGEKSEMQLWLYEGSHIIECRYGNPSSVFEKQASTGLISGNTEIGADYLSVNTKTNQADTTSPFGVIGFPNKNRFYRFTPPPRPKIDMALDTLYRDTDCRLTFPVFKTQLVNTGTDTVLLERLNAKLVVKQIFREDTVEISQLIKGKIAPNQKIEFALADTFQKTGWFQPYHSYISMKLVAADNNVLNNTVNFKDDLSGYAYSYHTLPVGLIDRHHWWNSWGDAPRFGQVSSGNFYTDFDAKTQVTILGSPGNWLISPRFMANSTTAFHFRAYMPPNFSGINGQFKGDDSLKVMVSADCGQTWQLLKAFHKNNTTELKPNPTAFSIPLSIYAGKQVMVAFQATAGKDSLNNETGATTLEDVVISDSPTLDLSLGFNRFISEPNCQNDFSTLSLKIYNHGYRVVDFSKEKTSIMLSKPNETFNNKPELDTLLATFVLTKDSIRAGDSLTVTIDTIDGYKLFKDKYFENKINVSINNASDFNKTNNILETRLRYQKRTVGKLPMTLSFEETTSSFINLFYRGEWGILDSLDLKKSPSSEITVTKHEGAPGRTVAVFGSEPFQSKGWLITPVFEVENETFAKFRIASETNDTSFVRVMITDDCGQTWKTFFETNTSSGLSAQVFKDFVLPLKAYAGKRVYLAWGLSPKNENTLLIDNIFIGKLTQADLAIKTLSITPDDCLPSKREMKVVIQNTGNTLIDFTKQPLTIHFNITYNTSDKVILKKVINQGKLAIDSIMTIKADSVYAFLPSQIYRVNASLETTDDKNPSNNFSPQSFSFNIPPSVSTPFWKTSFSYGDSFQGWSYVPTIENNRLNLNQYYGKVESPKIGLIGDNYVATITYRTFKEESGKTIDGLIKLSIARNCSDSFQLVSTTKIAGSRDTSIWKQISVPLTSFKNDFITLLIEKGWSSDTSNFVFQIASIYVGMEAKIPFKKDLNPLSSKIKGFYPNPTLGLSYLEVESLEHQALNWTLINEIGQIIQSKNTELKIGQNHILMDFEQLLKGIYFLSIEVKGEKRFVKFVKQ